MDRIDLLYCPYRPMDRIDLLYRPYSPMDRIDKIYLYRYNIIIHSTNIIILSILPYR